MKNSILHIDSSGRSLDSNTRKLSGLMVKTLKTLSPDSKVAYRNLSIGLPFVDEQWIEATFTEPDKRTEEHQKTLNFSTELVSELQQAQNLVIGVPIYNFNIPAVLKAWIDLYPCYLKMQVSVGIKSTLGKALIEANGYSLGEINNAE